MLTTYQKQAKTKFIATVVSLIVIAGIVVLADHLRAKDSTALTSNTTGSSSTQTINPGTTPPSTDSADPNNVSAGDSGNDFKDGAYSASSDYFVPAGNEHIAVTATLSGGIVTDVSVQNSESDPESKAFQEDFSSNYKTFVIGKKISGLHLTNVAGASDTTRAFSDALSQIASKAQA